MTLSENERRPEKREKPLTKVVVRRLPPQMSQDQFISQVSPLPEHNYIYMVKGDMSLGENAFARVYINFICPDDVYSFKERFDTYVFLDSKGHEYPAVVEFSPFQKIPKRRRRVRMDPKCNTIESDSYYLDFVADLSKQQQQEEKPEYTLQLNEKTDKDESTTPLLEYIKNKKAQKLKIREVRREEKEKKRREFERKKDYKGYDSKKGEDKSGNRPFTPKSSTSRQETGEVSEETKTDRTSESSITSTHKSKERHFEERRKEIKPRFPKKDYNDFKREDRGFKPKYYEEYKTEDKTFPKKVKKYSEKREERKMEAQKAEQRKHEQQLKEAKEKNVETSGEASNCDQEKELNSPKKDTEEQENKYQENNDANSDKSRKKSIEDKSESARRIRNKDRPTIAIYRPGMLSKRKHNDNEDSSKKENEK